MRKWDVDNHTSSRSLTRLAGNPGNNPAARNDHTTQPETEPALNRFALKPLALPFAGRYIINVHGSQGTVIGNGNTQHNDFEQRPPGA